MKKRLPVKIAVSGNTHFPVDMLRYDCCFPASSHDVSLIEKSLSGDLQGDRDSKIELIVTASGGPTVDRWRSFGWTVSPVG